jgi:hypothetical protein
MCSGVGLRFEGYPSDLKRYYFILAEEGCHPKAGERILNRINNNGFDLLTVQDSLNFDWIKDNLFKIGVRMTIIEPLEDWSLKYENGPWTQEMLPERFRDKK